MFKLADKPRLLSHPELVIGIAGPIGIDIEAMSDEIDRALRLINYEAEVIRVTSLMISQPASGVVQSAPDYFALMNFKMDYANRLCEIADDPEFLMRVAIEGIHNAREKILGRRRSQAKAASDSAYIIRQLKRPNEVALMRRVYGKQFVLISGYGSELHRREHRGEGEGLTAIVHQASGNDEKASALLLRDHDEGQSEHGQHLRDTFHLADVPLMKSIATECGWH